MHEEFWWGNLTERDHLKNLCVDEWIIRKRILKRKDARKWIGFI
jgi:hypothetical protein